MTPTLAARALLVMGCPWIASRYVAEPCAPACEPLATPQAKVKDAGEQG